MINTDVHNFDKQDEQHYGEQEIEHLNKIKKVEELATYFVCPNTGVAHTPYEHGAIKNLTCFGLMLLKELE